MKDAVIIGGGIAGLGAGLFAQTRGLDFPIYEKGANLACEDNLLWLAPNGLTLIERLGCLSEVQSAGKAQESMIFAARDLKPLMQLKAKGLVSRLGQPILAIRRRELYQILMKRFQAQGGKIHFGQELEAFELRFDHAIVRFKNQQQILAKRVIAADGIGSLSRTQLFPESEVHYQGLRTYLGQSRHPLAANFVGRTLEIWGQGSRFVLTSLDGKTAYWSAIERASEYTPNRAPLPEDLHSRLKKLYQNFHPDILTLLDFIVEGSVHRSNFGVVRGLKSYSKGVVTLIGDAAHGMPPNMGQGASLALEDAHWLVARLAERMEVSSPADEAAIDEWRLKRAKQMMNLANGMNVAFQPRSVWASYIRDCVARLTPDKLSERRMVQLYRLPRQIAAL